MKVLNSRLGRLGLVGAVLAAAVGVYLYLLTGTASRLPLVQPEDYPVTVTMSDVDNLVPASQVKMAGVTVGKVRDMQHVEDGVRVTFGLTDDNVAPLHEGATIRLGERSLVGEAYLDITDGDGKQLEPGSELPKDAVQRSTRVDDVLRSLDKEAREDLGNLVRSAGKGTKGTQEDLSAAVEGLGKLGREGNSAIDAIAAQSQDLRKLVRETTVLMNALDTGQGQIVDLVRKGDQITNATSGQRKHLEETMRLLPGLLDSARDGSATLTDVSEALGPVAKDLKAAAPPLSEALGELPATTRDLHGMLPSLSGVLDKAPATLNRVPRFSDDVRAVVPPARAMLRDVNPMLAYLKPYGPELAAYFANFNAVLQYTDEAGMHYIRLTPVINEKSPQSPLTVDALGTYNNPLPPAGSGSDPGPFTGKYPRVEQEPK